MRCNSRHGISKPTQQSHQPEVQVDNSNYKASNTTGEDSQALCPKCSWRWSQYPASGQHHHFRQRRSNRKHESNHRKRPTAATRPSNQRRKGYCSVAWRKSQVMTNFSQEYKHLNKATQIASTEEVAAVSNAFVLLDYCPPTSMIEVSEPAFDVNLSVLRHNQEQVKGLLKQYKDYFSSSSRIRQAPNSKALHNNWRMRSNTTSEPYRISTWERGTLRQRVNEMLHNEIIQLLKRSWALPVILVKKDATLFLCLLS